MSRTVFRLVLGGALLLIATACGPQPASEITPANAGSPDTERAGLENAEAQRPEGEIKPVVTVSRSPT